MITKADIALMAAISASIEIETAKEFEVWCRNHLWKSIKSEMMVCASGRLIGGAVVMDYIAGINCHQEFIESISRRINLSDRTVLGNWLETRTPQLISRSSANEMMSDIEIREMERFSLGNIAAHGIIEPDCSRASYFSFLRIEEELNADLVRKIQIITPHLHRIQLHLTWQQQKGETAQKLEILSNREADVLKWLVEGKSNAKIAHVTGRSPNTIKHQVASIMRKLGADTRAHAAALGAIAKSGY